MALSSMQKFCVFLMILGCLAIIAGSAAPFWIVADSGATGSGFGPWYYCVETTPSGTECHLYNWLGSSYNHFSVWFFFFHGTAGVSAVVALVLVFACLSKVCSSSDKETAKGVAGAGLCAGLLGVAAAVLFSVKTEDSMNMLILGGVESNGWAFIVFTSGTGILTFFAIVLLALPEGKRGSVGPI